MLLAIYFVYEPILMEKSDTLTGLNTGLILMGIGISLDSLKDYGKLNWLDKKVLHKPIIAKYYFILIGLGILSMILIGLNAYFSSEDNALMELSIGIIIFGIGMVGFLKSGIQATKDYMESVK